MSKALANRVTVLETALGLIISHAPQAEPTEEDYDDTESAYNNGMDVGSWEQAQRAVAALQGADTATPRDMVSLAIAKLREARDLLAAANAPKATERVRLALSSAEGAERNAGYRETRAQRTTKAFRVHVYARAENGDLSPLGAWTGQALDTKDAQRLALEERWDPRLDAASCTPSCDVSLA